MDKPKPQPGKLTPQPGQTMPNPNMPGEKHDDAIGRIDESGHMSDENNADLPPDVANEKASDRTGTTPPAPGVSDL